MTNQRQPKLLKGNPWWALSYALTSLKNYPIRNMGIALVLSLGVALPTTVFVWTASGTQVAVTDYFTQNNYQMYLEPTSGESYTSSNMAGAITWLENNQYVERVDLLPSTFGILQGESIPSWSTYSPYRTNYAYGIKDGRILLVTEEMLGTWVSEFNYEGNFSLTTGKVLVSQGFVDYTEECHGIQIGIGSTIDIDLLKYAGRSGDSGTPDDLGALELTGLEVVGIYEHKETRTILTKTILSIYRKNWDPFSLISDAVLGLADSVMILQEELDSGVVSEVTNRGFGEPVGYVRSSVEDLLQVGAALIGGKMLSVQEGVKEQFLSVTIGGLSEIWALTGTINTYLQSQILTVIMFPVLIMSLMLTVFTSETSVSRRKGEISALRAKGASFNQVFATFMWESLLLSVVGFVIGIVLAFVMAPLIGSTVGLFVFDSTLYTSFVQHLSIPPLGIIIGAAIALYLPAAYLLHVARRIDVSEVGQPSTTLPEEESADSMSGWKYGVGLGAVLAGLLVMPMIVSPRGAVAIGQILVATLILFVAAYLGSRGMRLVTARLSRGTSFLLGEKSLYLSQSLRRRRSQFIPMLVILTLTLTTTSMMLIQSNSFEATIDNELGYAIGADVRVEGSDLPLNYTQDVLRVPGVYRATPVIETWAIVGSNTFFLEGVDAEQYGTIGRFVSESFVSGSSTEVLAALSNTTNGIVISQRYSQLWDKGVGETIDVLLGTEEGSIHVDFQIVGVGKSAPGFGLASTADIVGRTFAGQTGFQVLQGGFALVNLDYLHAVTQIETASVIFGQVVSYANMTEVVNGISAAHGVTAYSAETYDLAEESYSIRLFLSGIEGLTMIAFILCAIMGLSTIALFLGSAVLERKQEYAIFRALGGTRKQVVSMVFGEFSGTVIASIAVSVLLGFVFGYSMSILTLGISPFSPLLGEVLALPVTLMALILSLESLVMIGACYFPARRAGSVDPAYVLRNL
ncbi:ABC transporter permease [Candidatus Thorarchaeota archaeon]|nr:MAG: ABC transporter permease [Candidatus Thorarchaeota archaeon]